MTDPNTLTTAALRLEPAEAAEVLRVLLLDADLRAGTAHTGADLDARVAEDLTFLREVVTAADGVGTASDGPPAEASPQRLLAALVQELPVVREATAEALTALDERETSLDLTMSISVAAIAIATSAAIIRPLITFEKERDGDRASTKLKIDVRGVRGLGAVIRELLPFLTGR